MRGEHDDDLGVLGRHPVVADERRLDAVLDELAEELERDVGDDLDVHPGVVVDLEADDGVHVRDVPPRLQLLVRLDLLEQQAELPVPARGNADVHARDRLGRRQARVAYGLFREWARRVLDSCRERIVRVRVVVSLGRHARSLAGARFGPTSRPAVVRRPPPTSRRTGACRHRRPS